MSLLSLTKDKTGLEYYTVPNLEEEKSLLLNLLKIVDKVARENNIDYWIDGGTLLGAVRHKGFIPWDDDIDICLLKKDFDKLIPLLYDYTKNEEDLFLYFYRRNRFKMWDDFFGSKKISVNSVGTWRFARIDITPMKVIQDSDEEIHRFKFMADIANFFVRGKTKYFSEIKEKYGYSSIDEAFIKKEKFLNIDFEKYLLEDIKVENKNELLVNYSFGDSIISRERDFYKYSDIFPIKEIEFEGYNLKCPNNINTYLQTLYGNYMKLPPLETRKPYSGKININHNLSDSKFNKYITKYVDSLNKRFYGVNTVGFKINTLIQHVKINGLKAGYIDIVRPFLKKITSFIRNNF